MKWKNNRFKGPKDKDGTAWRTSWRLDWSERKEGWKEVKQEERCTGSCRAHRPWLWNTDCILCINRKLLQGFEEGKWHDPHYVLRSSLWLLCGKKGSRRHRVAAGRLVRESGSSRWQVTVAWIRVLAAEVVRNRSNTCFWRWSRCNSLTGLMWDHGEPVTRWNQCLLTEMGKSRQGVGTDLSGTGEHGSSVLLRHATAEGEPGSQLRQTSLKVGERSGVEMELWEPSVYREYAKRQDWMKAQR